MSENRAGIPLPGDAESSATLVELFTRAATRSPGRTALRIEGEEFGYGRLSSWSEAVAALLHETGVRRGDRVALRMRPGANAIAAVLGILRAGAAYVPLDTRNPPARDAFIVSDSGVAALVGDPGETSGHPGPVVTEEAVAALREHRATGDAAPEPPGPQDVAYIIYTSGTTGRPKGVPVRHANVTALLGAASRLFAFSPDDRWLLFHSLAFDFSVWEVWGALSTGAELAVLPYWTARTPKATARVVRDLGITVLNQTPTAFTALTGAVLDEGIDLPDLRYVVFGGEKLTPSAVRPWAKRFGMERPHLVNMYGITETTVHATFHRLTDEDLAQEESVVGRPLPGFTHRIVTEDGRDAEPGEQGELWLAGPQVTEGYLNRPELTSERFTTGPAPDGGPSPRYYRSGDLVSRRPGGDLVYRGRADLQVKLRGHRVELTDVEAAVRAHPEVADTVVWMREFAPGDTRLVCAYTARAAGQEAGVSVRSLRGHVKAALPSYMHPAHYMELTELPRTVNGKADRAAVARLFEDRR
ncbi:amino acid adenylation domain-containing protein [Streptomyces fradiae]|uniref:amino acid adenylation domain-containing protein n=1 Tax=Streptomyces fradiae TaxID=1906 RepID=UPI002941EEC5|nr:amino acid adenylation domain-containing protein [Streptomyces fradiae]WOI59121.1 amino acid adenylation domain-containing protein [Streptomyces fradiae]